MGTLLLILIGLAVFGWIIDTLSSASRSANASGHASSATQADSPTSQRQYAASSTCPATWETTAERWGRGGPPAPTPAPSEPSEYMTLQAKIEAAIRRGARLRFRYRNRQGEISLRTVTPSTLGKVEYMGIRGRYKCVTGWCHLRGESRSFNLTRMKDVEVLE